MRTNQGWAVIICLGTCISQIYEHWIYKLKKERLSDNLTRLRVGSQIYILDS